MATGPVWVLRSSVVLEGDRQQVAGLAGLGVFGVAILVASEGARQ